MKTTLFLLVGFVFTSLLTSQTLISDANFEQALIDANIDSDGVINGQVATIDISTLTTLNVGNKNISDLTGIEDFLALETLNCKDNSLNSLDLSTNTNLKLINCTNNALTSINLNGLILLEEIVLFSNSLLTIDLSTNTSLLKFNGGFNPYTTLDFTSNSNLKWIGSPNGSLTSVNFSGVTSLEEIYLNDNSIGAIDASGLSNLIWLNVYNNNLTSINTSGATVLQYFNVYNNQLTNIDTATNANLFAFRCYNNQIKDLDLRNNATLLFVSLQNNALTYLDLRNGNNTGIISNSFNITGNPNLECVKVDDVAYSSANWNNKDAQTIYSVNENCGVLNVVSFKSKQFRLFPNPTSNHLYINRDINLNAAFYELINSLGKRVASGKINNNQINVSYLNKGVYFFKLISNQQIEVLKFIKN